MKRLLSLILLIFAGSTIAFAQENSTTATSDRKPVTSKFELMLGNAEYANHSLNKQVYKGGMTGVEATFGRFYRKSNSVSWELKLGYWHTIDNLLLGKTSLHNPANTSSITAKSLNAHYGAYYNWIVKERLQIRLGGYLDLNGGILTGDSHFVNNAASLEFHGQVYGSAQLRYGWNFKKWGLDLYANVATSLFGIRSADGVFTDFAHKLAGSPFSKNSPYNHIVFSSFHNTIGVDYEIGIDFAMPRVSLSLAYGSYGQWWHDYGVQNIRKNKFFKLGISVNFVGMHRGKTANRHF